MSNFYEQLCDTFIRPSRQVYNNYDLGQPLSEAGRRFDFQVYNNRQHKLVCSFYSNTGRPFAACLVYLHSLNGSRLESLGFVNRVLAKGLNFCIFDFSGTGLSQGKYVSLGFFEKYDIQAVLDYISQKFNIQKFMLWGRSMGAAAAIKFMSMQSSQPKPTSYEIQSLILDSPFHSLSQITVQLAKQRINMPEILIKAILMIIESSIEQKAGFKLSEMELLEDIKAIRCPVLLLTSKEDKLVHCSQSEKIYEAIRHREREIMFIKGEHNANREIETVEYVINFAAASEGLKKTSKQALIKSSKFLNYRAKNNLAISEAITSKSSTKLQNNSHERIRYDTCGDEELTCARLDSEMVSSPIRNMQAKIKAQGKECKKSINLFSPKIGYYRERERERESGDYGVKGDSFGEGTFGPGQSLKEKKFDVRETIAVVQTTSKNEPQKKLLPNLEIHKNCLQLNKSPTKQPPKIKIDKKNVVNNSIPASKTPEKIPQFLANHSQKLAHSEKRNKDFQLKANKIKQDMDNLCSGIEVNHFNIINEKLKKKKKKQTNRQTSLFSKEPEHTRNVSISLERKSKLSVKSPPDLISLKPFQENRFKGKLN